MAAHVRTQIRKQVVTTLTGLTTTGARVHEMPVYAIEKAKLPALAIYTLSEESPEMTAGGRPRVVKRTVQLAVEAYAMGTGAALQDALDQICKEVETALSTDPLRGGLAHDTRPEGVELTLSPEGEKPHGVARMSWVVDYKTKETVPDVPV